MSKAWVVLTALSLSALAQGQPAQPRQREEPPPPPAAEPAPDEAPPPEEAQQPQQPPPRPPDDAPPQPESVQQEDLRRLHLAFGASGVGLINHGDIAIGFSGEVGAKLVFSDIFNIRLFASYSYVEDTDGPDHIVALSAEPTLSFGFYSLGIGVMLGAADLANGSIGGMAGGFVAPVKLRFGTKITAEASLDLGVMLITSNPDGGVNPFGRVRFNVFL